MADKLPIICGILAGIFVILMAINGSLIDIAAALKKLADKETER